VRSGHQLSVLAVLAPDEEGPCDVPRFESPQ
jgi:hypothetical protein